MVAADRGEEDRGDESGAADPLQGAQLRGVNAGSLDCAKTVGLQQESFQ
jgi:hypothetical protein